MKSHEESWKTRYYQLESTLEQALLGFEKVLSQLESTPAGPEQPTPHIYKVARVVFNGTKALCCIANGSNLEYQFEFFNEARPVHTVSFQRSNTAIIPDGTNRPTRCRVSTKSYATPEPQVVVKEIDL